MGLPKALSTAASKERPSGKQWLGATMICCLLLLFSRREGSTVPYLCLTVQMPLLPLCFNSLTMVNMIQGQKTGTSLLHSPLLPLDIGNLATPWTLLPPFWCRQQCYFMHMLSVCWLLYSINCLWTETYLKTNQALEISHKIVFKRNSSLESTKQNPKSWFYFPHWASLVSPGEWLSI